MKIFKVFCAKFLTIIIVILSILFANITIYASTARNYDYDFSDVKDLSYQIFGNKKIKSIEYLYGFNESPDFVHVDFDDYGYAVYFKETMELMEYSPVGSLSYENSDARKYYAGPSNYYNKKDNYFTNIITGNRLNISNSDVAMYSK